MEHQLKQLIIGRDIPFGLIDGEFCRVIKLVPHAIIDESVYSFGSSSSPIVIRIMLRIFIIFKSQTLFWFLREFFNKGVVHKTSHKKQYAELFVESAKLPKDKDYIYEIMTEGDFRHIHEAFKEMDSSTQEILIAYQDNPYKDRNNIWLKILWKGLPKLHVYIYKSGGLEKLHDCFTPGSSTKFEEIKEMKIKEWKPIADLDEIE